MSRHVLRMLVGACLLIVMSSVMYFTLLVSQSVLAHLCHKVGQQCDLSTAEALCALSGTLAVLLCAWFIGGSFLDRIEEATAL